MDHMKKQTLLRRRRKCQSSLTSSYHNAFASFDSFKIATDIISAILNKAKKLKF